jgi:hypothetical protein
MARTVAPRNTILQYTQVRRATPTAFTPRTKFRGRHRRLALTLTTTRPGSMHDARNLAGNWVRDRRVRSHTTTRGRRRCNSRALRERWGVRYDGTRHDGAVWVRLLMLAAQGR